LGRWLTLQGQQSPCYDLRSSTLEVNLGSGILGQPITLTVASAWSDGPNLLAGLSDPVYA